MPTVKTVSRRRGQFIAAYVPVYEGGQRRLDVQLYTRGVAIVGEGLTNTEDPLGGPDVEDVCAVDIPLTFADAYAVARALLTALQEAGPGVLDRLIAGT